MATHGWWRWTAAAAALAAGAPSSAASQERVPPPRFVVVAGAFMHEHEGEGTSFLFGGRLGLPVLRFVSLEASFQHTRYRAEIRQPDGSVERPDVPLLLGDFQVQARHRVGRVVPYLGAGAGGVVDFRDDRSEVQKFVELTYTLSGGVRLDLPAALEGLGEVRLRGIGGIARDVTELVLGLGLSF